MLSTSARNVREEYDSTPFANGCLLARRLVERGVRSVHLHYGEGQPWGDHINHEKLNYRHAGRDLLLTDVYGGIVGQFAGVVVQVTCPAR